MKVVTLHLEPAQQSEKAIPLVRTAVEREIARLELGIEQARLRLEPFEKKYGAASKH